jgi:hypothetical protein
MELTAAADLGLAVHADVLVIEQIPRLAARADEVRELEQLA